MYILHIDYLKDCTGRIQIRKPKLQSKLQTQQKRSIIDLRYPHTFCLNAKYLFGPRQIVWWEYHEKKNFIFLQFAPSLNFFKSSKPHIWNLKFTWVTLKLLLYSYHYNLSAGTSGKCNKENLTKLTKKKVSRIFFYLFIQCRIVK